MPSCIFVLKGGRVTNEQHPTTSNSLTITRRTPSTRDKRKWGGEIKRDTQRHYIPFYHMMLICQN